jgi:hypothetical protein
MKSYSVPGLTSKKDLDILYEWARTVPKNGVIVELGSWFGRSAVAFAEGAYPSVKIYCIDYFQDWTHPNTVQWYFPAGDFWQLGKVYNKEQEFLKNTKDYPNITLLKLENEQIVYPYAGEQIDLLFIDAAHTNPSDLKSILYFKNFMKEDGLICGHDYHDRYPDVITNVKLLQVMYKTTATFYQNSTMWSIRIKE